LLLREVWPPRPTQSLRKLRENILREIAIISRKEVYRCAGMFPGGVSLVQKLDLGAARFIYETRQFKVSEKVLIHCDTTAISVYTNLGTGEPKCNIWKDEVY
jgi:hypothetical protein